jgi:hypothetical protein
MVLDMFKHRPNHIGPLPKKKVISGNCSGSIGVDLSVYLGGFGTPLLTSEDVRAAYSRDNASPRLSAKILMSAERVINTHHLLHNDVRFYTPDSEDSGRWRSGRTSQSSRHK